MMTRGILVAQQVREYLYTPFRSLIRRRRADRECYATETDRFLPSNNRFLPSSEVPAAASSINSINSINNINMYDAAAAADISKNHRNELLSTLPLLLRLRQTLLLCSKLIQDGDFIKSEHKLSELVALLNSISDTIVNGQQQNQQEVEELENKAFQILTEIRGFITSSSVDQAVIDALSFELPKVAARLGCASQRCLEIAECVIDSFTQMCNPRDTLSILCEALGSATHLFRIPNYFSPLFSAFPKVFVSIRRRQFQQLKAAVPVILNALKTISTLSDDDHDHDHADPGNLLHKAICIADSVKTVCVELQGNDSKQLQALLGLFVLQIMVVAMPSPPNYQPFWTTVNFFFYLFMPLVHFWCSVFILFALTILLDLQALVSMGMKHRLSDSLPLVLHLSRFLQYCGLTYSGLMTRTHVNNLLHIALGDDQDDCAGCFSHIWLGASLAVIWGYKWNEVAVAAEADLAALKDELQSSQTKRWESVDMLKHVFLCIHLPWELKQHAMNFLLGVMDGNLSQISHDESADYSIYMPTLYTALQAIQVVIMYAPDVVLRKIAFAALKKLLADFPTSLRFDILRALIKNSDSSSMIAVLVDHVKDEMLAENKRNPARELVLKAETGSMQGSCFWSASVLELVELVLRPPEGGPPSLPEQCDAVLSALNLYRFILITESTGKTNYTGVLSKNYLRKAHSEWLLPLRTLVAGIAAENDKDYDQLASDILCGLNPVELVLYRCIELTEEHLMQFA